MCTSYFDSYSLLLFLNNLYFEPSDMNARISLLITTLVLGHLLLHAQPTISFTFDDGVTDDMPGYAFAEWNGMILEHLDHAGVQSIFFVTGKNKADDLGQALLRSWSNRGHRIGNHTYTHPNYGSKDISFGRFRKEFLATDSVISQYPGYIQKK